MVMMSSERANERQLTFCSASLDDNNVWPVLVGGGGGLRPLLYPCPGKRYNKVLIFYLRPIASTDAPMRRRSVYSSVGMSQSLYSRTLFTQHYYIAHKREW